MAVIAFATLHVRTCSRPAFVGRGFAQSCARLGSRVNEGHVEQVPVSRIVRKYHSGESVRRRPLFVLGGGSREAASHDRKGQTN